MMPEFGSPSAVKAYSPSPSCVKLIVFASRSPCEANFFVVIFSLLFEVGLQYCFQEKGGWASLIHPTFNIAGTVIKNHLI
jgi:hypothetical protein